MPFASASVHGVGLSDAVDRAADEALAGLGGAQPDVGFLFVSTAFRTSRRFD